MNEKKKLEFFTRFVFFVFVHFFFFFYFHDELKLINSKTKEFELELVSKVFFFIHDLDSLVNDLGFKWTTRENSLVEKVFYPVREIVILIRTKDLNSFGLMNNLKRGDISGFSCRCCAKQSEFIREPIVINSIYIFPEEVERM